MKRTFVGIGFGPIQSGLFLLEAFESGHFHRLVVAEVAKPLVDAVRRSGGKYTINVAEAVAVRSHVVEGVEIYNPQVPADRKELVSAIAAAEEIATALPSVEFYDRGSPTPAELLAEGLHFKLRNESQRPTVVYSAENHNHAAELLRGKVESALPAADRNVLLDRVQFVNTVIGKMSGVVSGVDEIERAGLVSVVPSGNQAVLVEQFNRILIQRITLPSFERGLDLFQEKAQLLPFEEAKLYGHNAAHALMGYLAHRQGLRFMSEAEGQLREFVERAFLEESGAALCQRHAGVDPLFTEAGWREYVQDLVMRMTNPFLQDRVSRVIRDPERKLGWDDRLIGTMRLAMECGVQPQRFARGAAAALQMLLAQQNSRAVDAVLGEVWGTADGAREMRDAVTQLIHRALDEL